MLFWIVFILVLLAAVPAIICWSVVPFQTRKLSRTDKRERGEDGPGTTYLTLNYNTRKTIDAVLGTSLGAFIVAAIIGAVFLVPVWWTHSYDLGTIRGQHHVISVQQERIQRLTDRLDKFQYPRGSAILNADSPVAAIVQSLSKAEDDLAKAET